MHIDREKKKQISRILFSNFKARKQDKEAKKIKINAKANLPYNIYLDFIFFPRNRNYY